VIQDIHCFPDPIGPPAPTLNGKTIRGKAPPRLARITPKRNSTTRAPKAAAASDSASQSRVNVAKKSDPGEVVSLSISSLRSP
jgi:hypothetical protein